MIKYLHEFFGTFFLSLAIIYSLSTGHWGAYQPLVIGTILVVLIYGDRKVSGAHYNPAVTLGFWIRGKCQLSQALGYIAVQLGAGAGVAYLYHSYSTAVITPSQDLLPLGIAELLGTLILVYVILFVAISDRTANNHYYGLAIGYTVSICAYFLGGYGSHGCFNPAVALVTLLTGFNTGIHFIVIVLANLIGGVLAATFFARVFPRS